MGQASWGAGATREGEGNGIGQERGCVGSRPAPCPAAVREAEPVAVHLRGAPARPLRPRGIHQDLEGHAALGLLGDHQSGAALSRGGGSCCPFGCCMAQGRAPRPDLLGAKGANGHWPVTREPPPAPPLGTARGRGHPRTDAPAGRGSRGLCSGARAGLFPLPWPAPSAPSATGQGPGSQPPSRPVHHRVTAAVCSFNAQFAWLPGSRTGPGATGRRGRIKCLFQYPALRATVPPPRLLRGPCLSAAWGRLCCVGRGRAAC